MVLSILDFACVYFNIKLYLVSFFFLSHILRFLTPNEMRMRYRFDQRLSQYFTIHKKIRRNKTVYINTEAPCFNLVHTGSDDVLACVLYELSQAEVIFVQVNIYLTNVK